MNKEELINFLSQHHSKEDTAYLSGLIVGGTLDIRDVYELCSQHQQQQIIFRSSWLLEYVFKENPEQFTPVLKEFLSGYAHQYNQSAQRHYSKIAMSLSLPKWMAEYGLSYPDLQILTEASFDWLLNPKTPLAVQCNCIDILYQLSPYEVWITDELWHILENNLLSTSPALLSRTKKVLKKLNK